MKKIISLVLSLVMVSALFLCAMPVSAKAIHKSTVNLIGINKSESGSGYKWNNYDSILTLDGLNIETKDDYGLKIPDGATVVLKGDNYIEAKKAAVLIEAKVVFKGSGTLTLVSEIGIFCSSVDKTDSLSILGGTYKIKSSGVGIVSDFHRVSFSNSKLTFKTSGEYAVKAQSITTGAKTVIKADAPLYGKDKILIESSSITVNTDSKALISDNPVTFSKVTLKAGDSAKSLSKIDLEKASYDGQKCIKTISKYDGQKKSLFFGDGVPRYVDVIVLILGIGGLVAAVVVPVLYKKKKAMLAIALRDAEQNEKKPSANKK